MKILLVDFYKLKSKMLSEIVPISDFRNRIGRKSSWSVEYFFRVYITSSKHFRYWKNSRKLCKLYVDNIMCKNDLKVGCVALSYLVDC